MISVGILTSNYYPRLGGTEYASYFLANALNELEDTRAAVACSAMKEVPKGYRYPHPVYRSKRAWKATAWLAERSRLRMVKNEEVNILLGQNLLNGGLQGMQLQQKKNLPLLVASRGSDVQVVSEIGYGEALNSGQRTRLIECLNRADHVIALSSVNRADILEYVPVEHKLSVLPNGVFLEAIRQLPAEDYRAHYGISPDEFVLITVGRNSAVKRMSLLFQAMHNLRDYPIRCICVGPRQQILSEATRLGVASRVIATGTVGAENGSPPPYARLINLYRTANCFVSTSYVDCFSNAAIEALATGIPLVVGRKHGVQDVMQHSHAGVVLQNDSGEELTAALKNLILRREEYKSHAQDIQNSMSPYTWSRIAQAHRQLYTKFL